MRLPVIPGILPLTSYHALFFQHSYDMTAFCVEISPKGRWKNLTQYQQKNQQSKMRCLPIEQRSLHHAGFGVGFCASHHPQLYLVSMGLSRVSSNRTLLE